MTDQEKVKELTAEKIASLKRGATNAVEASLNGTAFDVSYEKACLNLIATIEARDREIERKDRDIKLALVDCIYAENHPDTHNKIWFQRIGSTLKSALTKPAAVDYPLGSFGGDE